MPPSEPDFTGIPITGSVVEAAMAPARCAAIPAIAMIAPNPFCAALAAKAFASSGVRCAEYTCTSNGMPRDASVSAAFFAMGRSLSLPMITATFFISVNLLSENEKQKERS